MIRKKIKNVTNLLALWDYVESTTREAKVSDKWFFLKGIHGIKTDRRGFGEKKFDQG